MDTILNYYLNECTRSGIIQTECKLLTRIMMTIIVLCHLTFIFATVTSNKTLSIVMNGLTIASFFIIHDKLSYYFYIYYNCSRKSIRVEEQYLMLI